MNVWHGELLFKQTTVSDTMGVYLCQVLLQLPFSDSRFLWNIFKTKCLGPTNLSVKRICHGRTSPRRVYYRYISIILLCTLFHGNCDCRQLLSHAWPAPVVCEGVLQYILPVPWHTETKPGCTRGWGYTCLGQGELFGSLFKHWCVRSHPWYMHSMLFVSFTFLLFNNFIVPMGFLPWEIRVTFPGESQLWQSCATQPKVHAECFSVFINHQTLTWTRGSLTCTQM